MAQLERPSLPPRLYRYRSINRRNHGLEEELDAVVRGYLYCSTFRALNDPMEGSYGPTTTLVSNPSYRAIVREILEAKGAYGIASLSELKHSDLMWTHYAGNHTGICISYVTEMLLQALPDDTYLTRVSYRDQPPTLGDHEAARRDAAARKVLSQKKSDWSYEREWRVLASVGPVSLRDRHRSVRCVYMGTRIDPTSRQTILDALEPLAIPIWEMTVNGYRHVATRT